MSKYLTLSLVVLSCTAVLLSGCAVGQQETTGQTPAANLEDKNTEIEVSGVVSGSGENFFITDGSGKVHSVDSYSIEFANLVGTTVTVSGQYSGDTLFVSELR